MMSSQHNQEDSLDSVFDLGGNELLAGVHFELEGPPPSKRPREEGLQKSTATAHPRPSSSSLLCATIAKTKNNNVQKGGAHPDPEFDLDGDDLLASVQTQQYLKGPQKNAPLPHRPSSSSCAANTNPNNNNYKKEVTQPDPAFDLDGDDFLASVQTQQYLKVPQKNASHRPSSSSSCATNANTKPKSNNNNNTKKTTQPNPDPAFDLVGDELIALVQSQLDAEGPPPTTQSRLPSSSNATNCTTPNSNYNQKQKTHSSPDPGPEFNSLDDDLFASVQLDGEEPRTVVQPQPSSSALCASNTKRKKDNDKPNESILSDSAFDSVDDDLFASVQLDTEVQQTCTKQEDGSLLDTAKPAHQESPNDVRISESKKTETGMEAESNEEEIAEPSDAAKPDSNSSESMFEDDDDAFLLEVANAIEDNEDLLRDLEEDEWVEEDGVEEENRFRTWIGRPHPMLMPEILSVVFGHITCGKTLKSSRLVCQVWKEVATPIASRFVTLRNASHVIEPYPYGLGYSLRSHSFTCSYPVPLITRIRIADPCVIFSKKEFSDFFQVLGSSIKYFGFDANFMCIAHKRFLKSVLLTWCTKALEEVELIGVTNIDFIENNCGIAFIGSRIGLKRFRIVAGDMNQREIVQHHHFSSVYKSYPPRSHREWFMAMEHAVEDFYDDEGVRYSYLYDGIVSEVLRSARHLQSLVLELPYRNSSFCLQRYAMLNVGLLSVNRNVSELTLTGEALSRNDFNRIQHCNFPLKKLVLGLFSTQLGRLHLENLLISVSLTLQELEVGGLSPDGFDNDDRGRLRVFRFNVGLLEQLKVLVIGDGCRLRVENINQVHDSLKELTIKCAPVSSRHRSIVRRFLSTFLERVGRDVPLKKLVFESCDGIWLHNRLAVRGLRSHGALRSVSTDCFISGIADCIQAYSRIAGLDDLCLRVFRGEWSGRGWTTFPDGVNFWPGLRLLKIVNTSQVWIVLRARRLNQLLVNAAGFYSLDLTGFMIYDDEMEEIARHFIDHVNSVRFTDCIIVKKGYEDLRKSLLMEGSGKVQFLKFTGIELNRINVGMRVRELFHRL